MMRTVKLSALLALFLAALCAQSVMISPALGSAISSPTTFQWTAAGGSYALAIGTAYGGADLGLYNNLASTSLSVNFSAAAGTTIYVTLVSCCTNTPPVYQYTTAGASGATVSIANLTTPGSNTAFGSNDSYQVSVHGAPGAGVNCSLTLNGAFYANASVGTTDGSGSLIFSGTFGGVPTGTWTETYTVGGIQAIPVLQFTVGAAPPPPPPPDMTSTNSFGSDSESTGDVVGNDYLDGINAFIINLTNSALGTSFNVGDSYGLRVHGPPNSSVYCAWTWNGTTWGPSPVGTTDGNGLWSQVGSFSSAYAGSWQEAFSVAGLYAAPVSFVISGGSGQAATLKPRILRSSDKLQFHTSRGLVEHPRADNIAAEVSVTQEPGGYRLSVSGSEVALISLDLSWDGADQHLLRSANEPEGWKFSGSGWANFGDAPFRRNRDFHIRTDWLAGPLLVRMASATYLQAPIPVIPDGLIKEERQMIEWAASPAQNSVKRWAIGPAFAPDATEEDIRYKVAFWLWNGLEFLRPLDRAPDLAAALDGLQPTGEFERQAVDCLRVAVARISR